MTITPNIFDYATSELSQDAFICYLLAFGKEEFKGSKEYNAAHKFLEECDVIGENIIQIKRQYNKIDILVETDKHFIIIEDKIYTEEHGDQIVRYVEALRDEINNKKLGKNIKVCYFKTDDYLRHYITTNKEILAQEDCKSLNREFILQLLKDIRQNNLIFDSFCKHWETPDNDVYLDDVSTWTRRTWFQYLKKLFEKYHINDNNKVCDINNYVPTPSGGFLATHFAWKALSSAENIEAFYDKEKQKKGRQDAGTYKQIELYFSNGRTSRVNLAHRFYSNNWDKDETTMYKEQGTLEKLQNQIKKTGYKNQNKMGASTAYKVMVFGNVRGAYKKFINRETSLEILQEIEKFISEAC